MKEVMWSFQRMVSNLNFSFHYIQLHPPSFMFILINIWSACLNLILFLTFVFFFLYLNSLLRIFRNMQVQIFVKERNFAVKISHNFLCVLWKKFLHYSNQFLRIFSLHFPRFQRILAFANIYNKEIDVDNTRNVLEKLFMSIKGGKHVENFHLIFNF